MDHTLYLAPLRGFTDHIYRNVHARHFNGIDVAIAPFVTTCSGGFKAAQIRGLLPENNAGMPVIPQILSNSTEDFIVLARRLFDLGYGIINWNLGCPFPQVAKKQRGSGLLPHPDRIDGLLERIMAAIPNRLSIKTRLGRHRFDEIFKVIRVFNRYPLEEVIVHPRTGIQMYGGSPDLDTFETLLDMTDHRIVYNGDILSPTVFESLEKRFPAISRWMLGRPVLANPFLPGLLKGTHREPSNPVAAFRRFHDDLFQGYREHLSGPSHLLERMKGFWTYFHIPFCDGARIRKAVHKAKTVDIYAASVKRFFESEACWTGEVRTAPMQRTGG